MTKDKRQTIYNTYPIVLQVTKQDHLVFWTLGTDTFVSFGLFDSFGTDTFVSFGLFDSFGTLTAQSFNLCVKKHKEAKTKHLANRLGFFAFHCYNNDIINNTNRCKNGNQKGSIQRSGVCLQNGQ
jgi:hypothetical protein